jgi:outer membrane receptor protein involved in Fe transport
MKSLLLIILGIACGAQTAAAQNATVYGRVYDGQSGEEIIGANVLLVGTSLGASTDLDGKYVIKNVPAGTYDLRVSYVGYATKTVSGLEIKQGESVKLDMSVDQKLVTADEVVVTAERVLSTEASVLAGRKKAAFIGDGISAEQMKRTPDATSGDALKRVTGIAIVDNKFVYVRGITDRYNGTTLDGASVTSTEVGKKSFSFDLIPSNLLENTNVVKSATPDLPGDFSGGLVQLNTLDFPTGQVVKLGLGSSYNDVATSRDFLVSQGGSRDWLGFDDGTRDLPPQTGSLTELAQSLPNNWAPRTTRAPYNGSFALSYGDQFTFGDQTNESQLGVIGSLSYSNSFQRTEVKIHELTSGGYLLRRYDGRKDKYSVLWGAIANLSYKITPLHKVSFKNSYSNSGEDDIGQYEGEDGNTGNEERRTTQRWTQRSVYTGQLAGEHNFPMLGGLQMQWRAMVSSSVRTDPDRKLIPYVRQIGSAPDDPFFVTTSDRSWERANDRTTGLGVDFSVPVFDWKTKFGALVERRQADYKIRAYRIQGGAGTQFGLYTLPIDSVYRPENFGPTGFRFFESPSNATSFYDAEQEVIAGYGMIDVPFSLMDQRFRFVSGARLENSTQDLYTTVSLSNPARSKEQLKKIDILPSANLTYLVNDITNVRLAYSQTVNRPEFRELAPVAYYDFDRLETVYGNPGLQRALIRNYDARFEIFPGIGELIAVSYFHKVLTSPIEEIIDVSSTPIRTYTNSDRATNRGVELEFRKSLDFLGGYLGNFMITGNYTRIESEVEVLNEITPGVFEISTRPLQGQSPYMINVAVLFTEPASRTSVSVLYNKNGRRIDAVGSSISEPDIYEEPRDLIDVSITQQMFTMFEAKFSIKNLNGKDEVLTKREQFYRSHSRGTSYSLSLSMSL